MNLVAANVRLLVMMDIVKAGRVAGRWKRWRTMSKKIKNISGLDGTIPSTKYAVIVFCPSKRHIFRLQSHINTRYQRLSSAEHCPF